MAAPSEEEVARRLPLWVALADLFLDGGPEDLAGAIVRAARDGEFSAQDVHDILHHEVGPVFYPNLLAVAGHWGDWGDDFVRETVCAYLAGKPLSWWKRGIARRTINLAIKEEWPAIKAALS